uniref:Integrase catalytic domain-containing protein n=1 Tax=Tanacetum cinerariifolium TaxID=118510 RepID=A0A699GP73_TANCI|nr:hypothetical protein [Tanacetum cinerariifolium]
MHTIMWRKKPEIETLSLDDLFNNLKAYESEFKGTSNSTTNSHSVAFLSSSSTNNTTRAVNTAYGINTSSTQGAANSSTTVENLKCVKDPKEQNEQLVKDLRTTRVNDVSYKTGLESVEARMLLFKKNESMYVEDIKLFKCDIYLRDLDITELKRKLELATKEKDKILDKCKTRLGYNAIPPPYTGNFMPPKPDLVYPSLDDFVDESVVEKSTFDSNEPKTIRKENGATIIEDWVFESNEEDEPKSQTGNIQQDLKDKGVIDSEYSRHMTGNRSYLTYYEKINGGFVAFGGNSKGGRITRKGKIRTGKLDFKDVYFVKELKFNLFSVSQMCDKKNSILFNDTACVVLSLDFKLTNESHVLLKVPRKDNMYIVDLKNVVPQGVMNQLCEMKGIKREFSVARTPQQNKVAERKNRTLIKAARVLVIKPHNKTPYELSLGRKPALSFMRPFGCLVTILNTIDHLGKFNGKANEGFFVGYSTNSKAFRVFNSRTRIVEENLHVKFSKNTPNIAGSGPNWLFDIDALTKSMNYKPVVTGNQSNGSAGEEEKNDTKDPGNEDGDALITEEPRVNQEKDNVNNTNRVNAVSSTVNAAYFCSRKDESNMLTVGSTMRIPLLYRGEYSQWSERFMNYLEEQTNGGSNDQCIKNGDQQLPRITQVSIAGTSSTEQPPLKDKSMFSDEEKKIPKIDHLARSLLIQGLSNDIYSLIDSNKTAKDLWDALARQMLGSEYGEQDRKAAVLYEYEMFKATEGELLLDTSFDT